MQDCLTSLDSVAGEGRMAADALANRVNALEASMLKVIEGKITVMEEAVAARQNQQEDVNESFTKDIEGIRLKEESEHVERVEKEDSILNRVVVVEDRVEGEIDDVRARVEKARADTTQQVQGLEDAVTKRCNATDDGVRAVRDLAGANAAGLDELTNATAGNFEMVREDAVKSKGQIAGLKADLGDVDDRIKINNLVATNVDMVVGSLEKEERDEAEVAIKKYFEDYVTESERKVRSGEEWRGANRRAW